MSFVPSSLGGYTIVGISLGLLLGLMLGTAISVQFEIAAVDGPVGAVLFGIIGFFFQRRSTTS